jgi:quinoprotein glucose dehydrogenase
MKMHELTTDGIGRNRVQNLGVQCSLVHFFCIAISLGALAQNAPDSGWSAYGHDAAGTRYSLLDQINRKNIAKMRVAWTAHTGALDVATDLRRKAAFEATPILLKGKLFLSTPFNHVLAFDPSTGEKLWEFDPHLDLGHGYSEVTSRGVSGWHGASVTSDQFCGTRIFLGTIDARLIALDAGTGKLCSEFGSGGQVDLTRDVDLRDSGDYQVTSSVAISKDTVIVGSSIGDNRAVEVERGIVRAFDARTGGLRWSWDPIPWAADSKPRTGAGNAWSTLSVDSERDLVFIPTGSASPDYFGGFRKGENKWANSVVALRVTTGAFVWGFQVVHHDLWDYDVASQPTLFTWKDGTPAVAITTKMGRIFVLNRLSGAPLLPVEEKAVPKSDIPGEAASATQPSGLSLIPEGLRADEAWGATLEIQKWCRDKISASRSEGIFTPPSLRGTIVFPGNAGGVNWGSAAYDPQMHALIMDTNRLAMWVKLIPQDDFEKERNSGKDNRLAGEFARQQGAPFAMYREPLLSPTGTPCNPPPWGTVMAVDLFTGKKLWDVPLGTYIPEMKTGSINLGGPLVTAGGLVFTAAAQDTFLRAFDSATGEEVWKYELPASGQATPMTYRINDKQYVVICAGGHGKLGTKQGDSVVAFTVP